MISDDLKKHLQNEGYTDLKEIPGRGICGIQRFMFTTGLVYGIQNKGYDGRYCYKYRWDAVNALQNWNGIGDPNDSEWIKHKGSVEYSNYKQNLVTKTP